MIILVDDRGSEERVDVDQLVGRLHPEAHTNQMLFKLARICSAGAKLKDGRTVDVACRPNPHQLPEPNFVAQKNGYGDEYYRAWRASRARCSIGRRDPSQ